MELTASTYSAAKDLSAISDVEMSGAVPSNGDHVTDSEVIQVGDNEPEGWSIGLKLRRAMSDKLFRAHLGTTRMDEKEYRKRDTFLLAYHSLGVVFGDLGTSPLYVYPTIVIDTPNEKDFLGILSIIFWTMTLVAVCKYVFIVLDADDHGEGGTFAIYSLLCQHTNVGQNAGKQYTRMKSDEHLSHFSKQKGRYSRAKEFLEKSRSAQRILLIVVMLGTCMVIGDGVLTPAISVLSAIGGIRTQFPSVTQNVVLSISVVLLVVLFALQRCGTKTVSVLFSPIMAAWCISVFAIGVYNIVVYYPAIFKALSPHYIVIFFINNHKKAWVALGGTVLSITGAEAMFCDLGHFNKRSIQVAFLSMIYPATVAAYAGETAYVIKHPDSHSDAFFKSVPRPVFWPMFIIATLAAIVASQSLISATFSVVKQSMALGCFPPVKLVHTSSESEGRVYSPEVNYGLMILCLIVVIGFRDATQIGNAFGVTVIWVMLITTGLVSLVMLTLWKSPLWLVVAFVGIYGLVEGVYMTAVLNKFPQGGWVPFAISFLFGVIMLSWNYGRQRKYQYEMDHKVSIEQLSLLLTSSYIQRVPGICFFYSDLLHGISPLVSHYVNNVRTLHEVIIFTTIRYIPIVTVLPSERFFFGRLGIGKGVYRCVARYGYQDIMDVEGDEFRSELMHSLRDYIREPDAKFSKNAAVMSANWMDVEPNLPNDSQSDAREELMELEKATQEPAVYVLGRVRLVCSENSNWWRKFVVNKVYALLKKNCRPAIDALQIPPSKLLQVGMVYQID